MTDDSGKFTWKFIGLCISSTPLACMIGTLWAYKQRGFLKISDIYISIGVILFASLFLIITKVLYDHSENRRGINKESPRS